jgi:DNA-binding NarL/FixJ family response regulator
VNDRAFTVVIVDDHAVVRRGLRFVLEAETDLDVLAEASDGAEAIDATRALNPDVLLLDMRLPDMSGVEVCREVTASCPETRVLVLTSFGDDDEVSGALLAGATGYVLKDISPDGLAQVVRSVAQGGTVLDPEIARRVFEGRLGKPEPETQDLLSPREVEVLQLMTDGLRNKEIAKTLWISEPTVKSHVSHILRKLGTTDRTQAVLAGIETGLVKRRAVE